jgi:hypothetical protein
MPREFKFLTDNDNKNDEVEDWVGATWMWDDFGGHELVNRRWELVTAYYNGIRNFLSQFPEDFIVMIHSITGNNIRHSSDSDEEGWGFDILNEPLTIEYYRFLEDNE